MGRPCNRCIVNPAEIYLSYARQYLCRDCFIRYFENRVKKTIEEYNMFRHGDCIGVALSGGKDSAALLFSIKKLYPNKSIIVIHINHGIGDYSKDSMEKARVLCEQLDIDFHVYDIRKQDGFSIPDFIGTKYGRRLCSICGMIRRWALPRMAKELGVDTLATGHNLDDTVEVMFNHFITGELEQLKRIKPILPPEHPMQVWKVKPLIKSPERDNFLYAMFNELPIRSLNCPYYEGARSTRMKIWLNEWEKKNRNIKFQLYSVFTNKLIPILDRHIAEKEYSTCKLCGGPSLGEICSVCRRKMFILELKGNKFKYN